MNKIARSGYKCSSLVSDIQIIHVHFFNHLLFVVVLEGFVWFLPESVILIIKIILQNACFILIHTIIHLRKPQYIHRKGIVNLGD